LSASIEDLIKACDLRKDDATAFNSLGLSYFEGEFFDLALERFKKACEIDETKSLYFNNLALTHYYLG
jgi:lipoprotein NlpI